jgi:chromosomal replication initiator protein
MRSERITTARPVRAPTRLSPDVLEEALVRHVGQHSYELWFTPYARICPSADEVVIAVPTQQLRDWLSKKFNKEINAAIRDAAGNSVPVRFEIDPEQFRANQTKPHQTRSMAGAHQPVQIRSGSGEPQYVEPPTKPLFDSSTSDDGKRRSSKAATRRWRRLDDFVVGACNRVAYAASQSAIETPGQGPSPLVIHGPVGTGKTHLLEAIYVGLRRQVPDWRITFATAEEFTNRFVQAMRTGQSVPFRKQFRDCDALLLDDLHFLGGKRKTQEEFLHTFDVLTAAGKPVIVTSDCHPRLTDDFVPELADRLVGGAVWGIQPPDDTTRLDLLRAKSAKTHTAINEEVLTFLARQLRGNVRELEGALNTLRHFSRVTGRPIDSGLAREALGDLLRHAVRIIRLEDIDTAVCQVMRAAPGTLQIQARSWAVSHPRMIAIYLARKHTTASYSEVGGYFGKRNHSTAVAAEKKVRQWLDADEALTVADHRWPIGDLIERIERLLGR